MWRNRIDYQIFSNENQFILCLYIDMQMLIDEILHSCFLCICYFIRKRLLSGFKSEDTYRQGRNQLI